MKWISQQLETFLNPKTRVLLRKLALFLVAGLPAFVVAVPLNFFLVNQLQWSKPLAYAFVLIVQVTVNFFACCLFVFKRDTQRSMWKQFVIFLSGISTARLVDWAAYSAMTLWLHVPMLYAQLFNVVVLSVLKFSFAQKTIEGNSVASNVHALPQD